MGKYISISRLIRDALLTGAWMTREAIEAAIPMQVSRGSMTVTLNRQVNEGKLKARLCGGNQRYGIKPYEYGLVQRPPIGESTAMLERLQVIDDEIALRLKYDDPQKRSCLGCSKPFMSEGIHNRLCRYCSNRSDESMFEAASPVRLTTSRAYRP